MVVGWFVRVCVVVVPFVVPFVRVCASPPSSSQTHQQTKNTNNPLPLQKNQQTKHQNSALPAYDEVPRPRWVLGPTLSAQAAVVVSRTAFTAEVGAAFDALEDGNDDALKVYR